MARRLMPLDLYKYLPKTNCKICGEETCMAFAMKLISREVVVDDCTPLLEPKYAADLKTLVKMVRPPQAEVVIGKGENEVKIGGEEVMYRHELTFYNQIAFAIDVHDEMEEDKLIERVKFINDYSIFRIGEDLYLDLVAVRSVSNDPVKFSKCVETVLANSKYPLVLCSFNTDIMKAGLKVAGHAAPLIYAATRDNWKDMAQLAIDLDCPLAIFEQDLSILKSLASSIRATGFDKIVLDPGLQIGEGLTGESLDKYTMLRRAAIIGDEDVGYPLLAIPALLWLDGDEGVVTAYREAMIAAMLIDRYANLLILHTADNWALTALLTLRQNIYTDPRIHPAVEPGYRPTGEPDEMSPIMITTNFALTYFTVKSDLESAGIDAHLCVVDTGGIGVESAAAGGQLNAEKIQEVIEEAGLPEKVPSENHKVLIPGFAARFSGELEDLLGWEVHVGPKDSSGIKAYLEKKWYIEE